MAQEFTVLDMTCQSCAASVTKAVSRLPGVNAVDIDIARNNVRVEAAEDVTPETIVAAINAAGYTEIAPATPVGRAAERWRNNGYSVAIEEIPSSATSGPGCSCCG